MNGINEIFPMVITSGQIFLQFSIVTRLLKIKSKWWFALLYSIFTMLLASENRWIMLTIFFGSTFIYYFVASRKKLDRIKLSVLAVASHQFLSLFINNIILLIFAILLPSAGHSPVRFTALLVYAVMFGIIKYKKIVAINLIRDEIIFILSSTMMLVGVAVHVMLPISVEEVFNVSQILNLLFMITVQMIIVTYVLYFLAKLTKEIEKLENHSLFTETLEQSLENLNQRSHDSQAMLDTLLGHYKLKEWNELGEYLTEMANDVRHDINIGKVNARIKDHMSYLYGIVLAKVTLSITGRITFYIDVTAREFALKTVSKYQLSRMVGNLLDNAFEAAGQSKEKYVSLRISNTDTKGKLIHIVITNSVDAPVDVTGLTTKGHSSKEGHSGYGLYYVQSTIEEQREEGLNAKFVLSCSDDTFTAELIV